ncbi:MAG: polysulfide reductase NrfD [Pseudodesulfovibrio sp.]
MSNSKSLFNMWLVLLAALVGVGVVNAILVLSQGLGSYNQSDVVFWGLPMAGYLFFGLTAAGLTFLSSLPSVFGLKHLYPIAKRSSLLAFAMLLTGLLCKGLDLGPLSTVTNLGWVFFSPNLSSPIWWMAVLYGFYLLLVLAKFWKMHKGQWHGGGAFQMAIGALFLSVFSFVALSLVFGTVVARPAWLGASMGLTFLVTALASGLAALLLVTYFQGDNGGSIFDDLAKYLKYALAVSLIIFIFRLIVAYSTDMSGFDGFLGMSGSLSFNLELWIGMVIPLIMLALESIRKIKGSKALASLFVLVGMFAGRLEQLLSANVIPMGVQAEGQAHMVSYMPSLTEWGVIALAIGLSLGIYSLAVRSLNLDAMP